MSTAASLIKKALFLNGASSPINPASPELVQLAYEALIDMLVEWDSLGILIGFTLPTNPSDELDNPTDTNQVIQYQLSVISAPLFQLTASPMVISRAAQLMIYLEANYQLNPVSAFPATLPIGSGNYHYINGAQFYGESELELLDQNGIPLLGGAGS